MSAIMINNMVIYRQTGDKVDKICAYFQSLEIALIKNIKFVRKNNEMLGNYHIEIEQWYNNSISKCFYKSLNNPCIITKMVYDDPYYFEIYPDDINNYSYLQIKNNNYNYTNYTFAPYVNIKDVNVNVVSLNKIISGQKNQIKELTNKLYNTTQRINNLEIIFNEQKNKNSDKVKYHLRYRPY
jgi:hypothetical protein